MSEKNQKAEWEKKKKDKEKKSKIHLRQLCKDKIGCRENGRMSFKSEMKILSPTP